MIDYAATWFINRTTEIDLVYKKVDWLLNERLLEKRTVIFTGEHGVGKTWLLLHLWQRFSAEVRLKCCYLDLSTLPNDAAPQEILHQICQSLNTQLFGTATLADILPEEQARILLQRLSDNVLSRQPLVLLLDSVYETGAILLSALENYLLAPLAVRPKVLLVMAGRGQIYPWREPELRLRAEFINLEPFTAEHTREQIARQFPSAINIVEETFLISSGNPKANLWLATHQNQAAILSQLIDEMLAPIPQSERRQVRTYLEAVAIPRMFDDSNLPLLMYAYSGDGRWLKPSRQEIRKICDALLRPGLISWNTEQGGYVLPPSTRNLILRYLCAAESERWTRLHTAMLDLYTSWLRDYPQNQQYWQAEVDYHQEQLRRPCL